jgi:hypothetical protein
MFDESSWVWALPVFIGVLAVSAVAIFFIVRYNKKHPVIRA